MATDPTSSGNGSASDPGNGLGSALLAMSREWTSFIGQRVQHDVELGILGHGSRGIQY
jgi:hypothetical protein